MVSFVFFVFVRHTAHCFLLLVSCMLYVVKKHCPEEAHLNRWAKRGLIIKIARRSNLSACFEDLLSRYSFEIKTNSTSKSAPSFASCLCWQRQDCFLPVGDGAKFGKYCQKHCFPKCFQTIFGKNLPFVEMPIVTIEETIYFGLFITWMPKL